MRDWPAIWPIWHEVVAAGDTYTYDPASSPEAARASAGAAPYEAWLAEVDGTVLGTYHLAPNHSGPGSHVANASYMVAEAARGKGLGRAMVEHSLARAHEAGYLGIQFNAVTEMNVHAIHLYEQLGFDTIGVVPRRSAPQGGLVGLRVMYRDV